MTFELPVLVFCIAYAILGASFLLCLYRIIIGPTAFDRILSLDLMSFVAIAAIVVFSIQTHSLNYLSVLLIFAAVGFISVVGVGKFLSGGDIVDRDS